MTETYCKWHHKKLEDVTEHEEILCSAGGMTCDACENLVPGNSWDDEAQIQGVEFGIDNGLEVAAEDYERYKELTGHGKEV